ncbi:ECF RNA polymerase sigma factor SigE [Gemmata obscuriglobus]|uniref:RNA polymerase sigma-70 region 2 domain-containing protein n=1 Tax=Gemmata obscuriglobus TaxID=114 RepID=A0A2Z3HAB1_9BACT|nr:hypothetical protein C1280_35800 [Gemmata obscuriglobus]QEG32203.1 ECF RNA polymerase sigma factor SigE [Gemmata obscuriglobus]VTS11556.1 sigma-70 family rna polymerase sigma factor : RNA polymerase sigma factor, sigma-70 family OS=Singulisphaera acidiphila (strain ATCC BAA-1392 / DSM 18658 / VKM B-2454 / MOB10) GN=Sinac_2507 PE=4 SV=1: Sigma70_r2 [Gemmata obscuriglobus UQM 2246]
MSQSVLTGAVNRARRAARADATDGELVARFAGTGDPDAFAQLVRRHGPTVLAVCRRVTGHRHEAEDAFQATFLVLARRASELDSPDTVGGWLFGVAVNTARAARRRSARRAARESLTGSPPDRDRDGRGSAHPIRSRTSTPARRWPSCPSGTAPWWSRATCGASPSRRWRVSSVCRSGPCTAGSRPPAGCSPGGCGAGARSPRLWPWGSVRWRPKRSHCRRFPSARPRVSRN